MRKKAKLKTIPWDMTKYLKTEEDIAEYLAVVFEDGDTRIDQACARRCRARKGHGPNREGDGPRA